MKNYILTFVLLAFGYGQQSCKQNTAKQSHTNPPLELSLKEITTSLHFPTAMDSPQDGTDRLFVCEQEGQVQVIEKGVLAPTPFLDLTQWIVKKSGYDERGLLGIVFHPKFKENRKFYVYYSTKSTTDGSDHKSVVEEFQASTSNPNVADMQTRRVVLTIEEPEWNHNGGDLKFGADGYLYISLGDGGGSGDKHGSIGNGQSLETLLGKILRIDINGAQPYAIPSDNPFVKTPNAKPEIYAYGFRNPWRMSFDSKTGKLFVGEVGQNQYEEVDIVEKGGNYGWRMMEGLHEYEMPKNQTLPKLIAPIYEYPHGEGISITGGCVYRGGVIPSLTGKYVFADYVGPFFYLSENNGKWTSGLLQFKNKPKEDWQIYSFSEDNQGEMYILAVLINSEKGAIYKIVK